MEHRYKIKVVFHKSGPMRFFSQLDIVRVLERSLRRAHLPLYFTKGFNPHPKMSFSNALKLGVAGDFDVAFYFTQLVPAVEFQKKLTPQLPQGLSIVEVNNQA
jgi:radical SAM-linked protein